MPGIPSKDASFVRETPRNYALTVIKMQNAIYHWIPVSVLAEITKQSPRKLQKLYRKIIQDDCIPL